MSPGQSTVDTSGAGAGLRPRGSGSVRAAHLVEVSQVVQLASRSHEWVDATLPGGMIFVRPLVPLGEREQRLEEVGLFFDVFHPNLLAGR